MLLAMAASFAVISANSEGESEIDVTSEGSAEKVTKLTEGEDSKETLTKIPDEDEVNLRKFHVVMSCMYNACANLGTNCMCAMLETRCMHQ